MALKYKVGDRVRIKSLDWYNENKDEYGQVDCGSRFFFAEMSDWCGKIATIKEICKTNCYRLEECYLEWTDEMIEGLVEEERVSNVNSITQDRVDKLACKINEELPSGNPYEWECPEGYQFVDENGNVINATKIVLEKKKKEYPKTYEECCKVLGLSEFEYNHTGTKVWYRHRLMAALDKLILCRDAYWKIAGDEMGLDGPWEPSDSDYITGRYCIFVHQGNIICSTPAEDCPLTFPTEEMRDAFYEAFRKEIEICKELL